MAIFSSAAEDVRRRMEAMSTIRSLMDRTVGEHQCEEEADASAISTSA